MPNTIQLKRSSVSGAVPSAGSLSAGELAVNTADGIVYLKKDSGSVITVNAASNIDGGSAISAGAGSVDGGSATSN